MDDFLNELYGTSATIGGEEDVEKNAAADFLVKLAADEGIDLNDLSDEEVGGLLEEVEKTAAEGGFEPETDPEPEPEPEPDPDLEAQEKLAEHDFLGRAMAHAYVNEMAEIEKEAAGGKAGRLSNLIGHYGKAYKGAGGGIKGVGAVAKREGQRNVQAAKTVGRSIKSLVTGKAPSAAKKGAKVTATSARRAALKGLGEGAKQLAPAAAVAGGVGAGGYGASKLMDKKSFDETFESAAQERAYEMLANAGYDVEKIAQADVDQRALQMLAEAGYQVVE